MLLATALVALTITLSMMVALFAASTLRAQPTSPDSSLGDLLSEATETHRFSLVSYELTHLPNRWLTNIALWLDPPELDEAATFERWFGEGDESERKAAELLLERRIAQSVSELELDTALPLFGRVRLVWPPVDVDLTERLHVLVAARRDEVRLVRTVLLTADVQRDDYEQIESIVEADERWSAWVGRVGGVALYPASVVSSRNFLGTLQVMAHEWTHHYLSFYPLGLAYGRGSDMRTINETVADIVGDELGSVAAESSAFVPSENVEATDRWSEIRAATDPILRQLRIDVDALLAEGEVEEAERLMESVRLQLIDMGRPFRRINQAFLAFRGSYGASPSSPSPWGRRLIEYRADQEDLATFLEALREVGSPDKANNLLPP